MITLIILLAELVGSAISLVWISAMLGFANDIHEGEKPSRQGKAFELLCKVLAFIPLAVTAWLGWRYYFSTSPWDLVPFGWWLHVVVSLVCFPLCWALVYLYDNSYYKNRI